MKFSEKLNRYLEDLGCSANKLAEISGIPKYTISRYRNGARTPKEGGKTVKKIADGILRIAAKQSNIDVLKSKVYASLNNAILSEADNFDFEALRRNFDLLIKTFDISLNKIAEHTNYNRSSLYRMRTGQGKLRDPHVFVEDFAEYMVENFADEGSQQQVTKLISYPKNKFENSKTYFNILTSWLTGAFCAEENENNAALRETDVFDLNEYLWGMSIEKNYPATSSNKSKKSKEYYGLDELYIAIKDFIEITANSKSYKDVIIYNDLPIECLAADEFTKKQIIAGFVQILMKGINVKIIHCLDRPLNEFMLSIHSLTPIYMTGRATPLFLDKDIAGFHNCLFASGGAILRGSAVVEAYEGAVFRLLRTKDAVNREYRNAESLVSKARPLMKIYKKDENRELENFINKIGLLPGRRVSILSSPPIYTISDGLLEKILKRNNVANELVEKVYAHVRKERKWINHILKDNPCIIESIYISKDEFEKHPVNLSPARGFIDLDIPYNYEEYEKHISETIEFMKLHPNYKIAYRLEMGFQNIQITMLENVGMLISKNKSPVLHFVARNSRVTRMVNKIVRLAYDKYS